jgi:hypothetical protein
MRAVSPKLKRRKPGLVRCDEQWAQSPQNPTDTSLASTS